MKYDSLLRIFILLMVTFISVYAEKIYSKGYSYIDTNECSIPIKDNLIQETIYGNSYSYIEKDYDGNLMTTPTMLSIDPSEIVKSTTLEKILENKYRFLKNTVHKDGYTIYYSEDRIESKNKTEVRVLILGKTIITTINYGDNEIDYLIDYCKKHKN